MKEAPLKNLHTIVARFVQALEVLGYVNDPDRPLILFGHSFGAMQVRGWMRCDAFGMSGRGAIGTYMHLYIQTLTNPYPQNKKKQNNKPDAESPSYHHFKSKPNTQRKQQKQTLEVARLLRAKGHTPPHYLIFSGCPPSDVRPHIYVFYV